MQSLVFVSSRRFLSLSLPNFVDTDILCADEHYGESNEDFIIHFTQEELIPFLIIFQYRFHSEENNLKIQKKKLTKNFTA
jgi:hypothetical protein